MKKIDLEILIDYLNGLLPGEDKLRVEDWINIDSENKDYFDKLKRIWNVPPAKFSKPDTEDALKNVLARINTGSSPAKIYRLEPAAIEKPFIQKFIQSPFIRAAAAITIMICAAYFISNIFTKEEVSLVHIASDRIQKIKLSDGTEVTLDKGSSFSYPKSFNAGKREVSLKGEAFFEVSKNEKAPFTVNVNGGTITVLGTKFNIRAWDKSSEVVVAVTEGKVSLVGNSKENGVVITKGKMSRLEKSGITTEPVDVDMSQYLSWINKQIYFKNTSLEEVIDQIERWYDIRVELENPELLKNRITVFIDNKPLEENLDLVCMLLNMKYEINKNVVRLIPNI